MDKRFGLFCGRSNIPFAESVGRTLADLEAACGVHPEGVYDGSVPCIVRPFNDGEPHVQIPYNVRDRDAFIIQSTNQPGDNFVELVAMVNAAKLAAAGRITAVIPYFGYGRQDRKLKSRTPITAQAICIALEALGVDRIVTTDLHAGQIQGFFRRPFDNLEAGPVLLRMLRQELKVVSFADWVLVSPDDGGLERCRETGKKINCANATFVVKSRPEAGVVECYGVRDPHLVDGRDCVLIDDILDTANSLVNAAHACVAAGARRIFALVMHPLCSQDQKTGVWARDRIAASPIERLYVSDTVQLKPETLACSGFREKVCIVPVGCLFGEALFEIDHHGSVSAIFDRMCARIFEG
ncbi:MAG: ribose-phosphate diphosphokinase [Candidatus Uhrbacteria bacterium]